MVLGVLSGRDELERLGLLDFGLVVVGHVVLDGQEVHGESHY